MDLDILLKKNLIQILNSLIFKIILIYSSYLKNFPPNLLVCKLYKFKTEFIIWKIPKFQLYVCDLIIVFYAMKKIYYYTFFIYEYNII